MSHLWNPLATAQQLEDSNADNALPVELQDSIRYSTARLTQAAGILLRLPQDIAAQAVVDLMRFWVVEKLMQYEFSVSNTFMLIITGHAAKYLFGNCAKSKLKDCKANPFSKTQTGRLSSFHIPDSQNFCISPIPTKYYKCVRLPPLPAISELYQLFLPSKRPRILLPL
jgi:hypothetical protein